MTNDELLRYQLASVTRELDRTKNQYDQLKQRYALEDDQLKQRYALEAMALVTERIHQLEREQNAITENGL